MRNKQEVIRICDVNTPGISQSLARQPHLKNRAGGNDDGIIHTAPEQRHAFPPRGCKTLPRVHMGGIGLNKRHPANSHDSTLPDAMWAGENKGSRDVQRATHLKNKLKSKGARGETQATSVTAPRSVCTHLNGKRHPIFRQ